jgi:hypothetical protein
MHFITKLFGYRRMDTPSERECVEEETVGLSWRALASPY